MIVKKITSKNYDIYDCAKWEMTVKDTIKKRREVGLKTKGLDRCFVCDKKFEGDDFPYLAMIRNYSNQFICDDCANKIIKENDFVRKNLVELIFVLDQSGSMWHLEEDTIGSYNKLLEEQKDIEGDCIVSTVLFNSNVKILHDRVNIKNVEMITSNDYKPNGNTALYDAICETIDRIDKKLSNTPEKERPSNVMFVIITDGQENDSRKFTAEDVKSKIERQKDKYNWDFNFIGANIDVVTEARKIGIASTDSFAYTASDYGTKSVYTSLSASISNLRTTGDYDKTNLSNNIQ